MGMYTELYLSVGFKDNLPEEVVAVLEHMFNAHHMPRTLPDHPFFQCSRWDCIGSMSSFYFVPMATSNLYKKTFGSKKLYLTTRSDLKNYDNDIQQFLDWVMPYIDACDGDYLGYTRYEEDKQPTLIYYKS